MEPSEILLKLVLDELGISAGIQSVGDRKRIQKAVYLAQAAGVDLGYFFGWYVMGPYSPALADEYYGLESALEQKADGLANTALRTDLKKKLKALQPALQPPHGSHLSTQDDWLELLASIHFLETVSKYNPQACVAVLRQQKPHLADSFDLGRQTLRDVGLLG